MLHLKTFAVFCSWLKPLSSSNYSTSSGENRLLGVPFNLLFCFASRGLDHHVKFFKMPRLMLECLRLMMLTSLRNPTQTLNKLGFIFTKYPDTYYNSKSFRRISWINQYSRTAGTGSRTILIGISFFTKCSLNSVWIPNLYLDFW